MAYLLTIPFAAAWYLALVGLSQNRIEIIYDFGREKRG